MVVGSPPGPMTGWIDVGDVRTSGRAGPHAEIIESEVARTKPCEKRENVMSRKDTAPTQIARGAAVVFSLVTACVGSASRAQEPNGIASEGPCAAFDREQAPYVAAIRDAWPAHPPLSPSFGRCFASKGGAWGISLDHVESVAGHVVGRWSLVHLEKDGKRVAVGPTLPHVDGTPSTTGNLDDALTLDTPALFDFDGDGEDEVLLRLASAPGGRERVVAGHLWSFVSGGIVRYARAPELDIEAMRDVDLDGRPDLETFAPWQAPSRLRSPCAPPVYRVYGPLLVAHAKSDGTFAVDDEVTRAVAERSCASVAVPFAIATSPITPTDGVRVVTSLACARMLGASTEEIEAVIDAACPSNEDGCAQTPTCDDARLWRRFAAVPPPLKLP
jgi:hypothetical protein